MGCVALSRQQRHELTRLQTKLDTLRGVGKAKASEEKGLPDVLMNVCRWASVSVLRAGAVRPRLGARPGGRRRADPVDAQRRQLASREPRHRHDRFVLPYCISQKKKIRICISHATREDVYTGLSCSLYVLYRVQRYLLSGRGPLPRFTVRYGCSRVPDQRWAYAPYHAVPHREDVHIFT